MTSPSKDMMTIGSFPFMLDTAPYRTQQRSSTYRWKELGRIGRKPVQQYVGPGSDRMTLRGEILSHWRGGWDQLDAMRAAAAGGSPLIMIEGHSGRVLGAWVITKIDENGSEFAADGSGPD